MYNGYRRKIIMVEAKKMLKVKNPSPDALGNTCEFCNDTFTTARGLATHLRSCADNPVNLAQPEIKPVVVDKEEVSKSIIDSLNLPDDVKEKLTDTDLDEKIQKLLKEVTDLNTAKKVKEAIEEAEDKKLRQKLKKIGYQQDPVVYGKWKKIILSSVEHIASCCNREENGGWKVVPGLCTGSPTGAIYMTFKKEK